MVSNDSWGCTLKSLNFKHLINFSEIEIWTRSATIDWANWPFIVQNSRTNREKKKNETTISCYLWRLLVAMNIWKTQQQKTIMFDSPSHQIPCRNICIPKIAFCHFASTRQKNPFFLQIEKINKLKILNFFFLTISNSRPAYWIPPKQSVETVNRK